MVVMLLMSSVVMLFISFTTAVRGAQGGRNLGPGAATTSVSNWVPLTLPVRVLLLNTAILLLSSTTLEIARRRAAQDVALAPIADIPGIRVSDNHSLPWLWATILLGAGFLAGQVYAWRLLRTMQSHLRHQYQQLVLLHPHRSACRAPAGRIDRSALCRADQSGCASRRRPAASSSM